MTLKERKQKEFAQRIFNEIVTKHDSIRIRKIEEKTDFLAANIVSSFKPNKICISVDYKYNIS